MSTIFFALLSCNSLRIFVVWCCLSFLCMSLARDSANGGFVSMRFYISCSLSILRFFILYMLVPSGLYRAVFVGCCMSS